MHYRDASDQVSASSVAAGIVNPITGRRFVKSWRIRELIDEASSLYSILEQAYGIKIWYDLPLIRTLFNRGDHNDWLARSGDEGYPEFMEDRPDLGNLPQLALPAFAYGGVKQSARVDVGKLVEHFRNRLVSEGRIDRNPFSYGSSTARYDRVIYCEGWRARFNPLWSYLPHGGNKGEVLTIKTDPPPLTLMYKHRIFLVPLTPAGTYWVGATSGNDLTDTSPTPNSRQYLLDKLNEIIAVPYEVVEHRAAVRPTVKDRRMIIGAHPGAENHYLFNGLGTKGASLAPLGSKWLFELLELDRPVPDDVSIARFKPNL